MRARSFLPFAFIFLATISFRDATVASAETFDASCKASCDTQEGVFYLDKCVSNYETSVGFCTEITTKKIYACCIIDPTSCKAVPGGACRANCDPGPSGELYDQADGNCYTPGLRCCVPFVPRASTEAAKKGKPIVPAAPEKLKVAQTFGYNPPLGKDVTLPQLVGRVIKNVLPFIGALFFATFLFGGVLWLTAGGKEKQVERARSTLVSAVIGMLIVAGAYAIVFNLLNLLGRTTTGSSGPQDTEIACGAPDRCVAGTRCPAGENEVLNKSCGVGQVCCGK